MKVRDVLVTGGCGYIGSHATRQLSEAGYRVTVYDNLSTGRGEALLNGEQLVEGDLADLQRLDQALSLRPFQAVFHFAASIDVAESVSNPYQYYQNNTINTLNLIQRTAFHQIPRFIFSSTAAVYGQTPQMPVDESTDPNPQTPYGWSKLMGEQMLRQLAQAANLQYMILRYFNVAGADPHGRIGQCTPNATHLIKVACEAAAGKRAQLTIYGDNYDTADGSCIRDYIHVEDLARAHLQALEHLEAGGENLTLNCGYGHGHSVKEVVATVKEVTGQNFPVIVGKRRPGDVGQLVARADSIRKRLGWQPHYDELQQIIRDAYRWEQKASAPSIGKARKSS